MPLPPARAIPVHVSGSGALDVTCCGLKCCDLTGAVGLVNTICCSVLLSCVKVPLFVAWKYPAYSGITSVL